MNVANCPVTKDWPHVDSDFLVVIKNTCLVVKTYAHNYPNPFPKEKWNKAPNHLDGRKVKHLIMV